MHSETISLHSNELLWEIRFVFVTRRNNKEEAMKRIVALFLLMCFCSPTFAHPEAHAQEHSGRWLKVSTDVLYAFFGAYLIDGEFKLSDHVSLIGKTGLINTKWTIKSDVNQLPGIFGKLAIGLRYYPFQKDMTGLFLQDTVEGDYGRSHTGTGGTFGTGPSAFPYDADMFTGINKFDVGYSLVTDFGLFIEPSFSTVVLVNWGWPNPQYIGQMLHFELRLRAGWAF